MQRWAWILGILLGISLGLTGLREWQHRNANGVLRDRLALAEESFVREQATLAETSGELTAVNGQLMGLQVEQRTLSDRITNLEAQRDHLRAEVERQEERARIAEGRIAEAQAAAEEARHDLLAQSALPRQLETQLDAAHARIARLENSIDADRAANAALPQIMEIAGLASDSRVVALSGTVAGGLEGPFPFYLCRRDRIVCEGWINRREKDVAIAHVEKWIDPASTLVKGEKVFILPRTRP